MTSVGFERHEMIALSFKGVTIVSLICHLNRRLVVKDLKLIYD